MSSEHRLRNPRPVSGCHQCSTSPSTNWCAAARRICSRARSGRAAPAPSRPAADRESRMRRSADRTRCAPTAGCSRSDRAASRSSGGRRNRPASSPASAPRRRSHWLVDGHRATLCAALGCVPGDQLARVVEVATLPEHEDQRRASGRARARRARAGPRTDRGPRRNGP